jgi:hypothetical protein
MAATASRNSAPTNSAAREFRNNAISYRLWQVGGSASWTRLLPGKTRKYAERGILHTFFRGKTEKPALIRPLRAAPGDHRPAVSFVSLRGDVNRAHARALRVNALLKPRGGLCEPIAMPGTVPPTAPRTARRSRSSRKISVHSRSKNVVTAPPSDAAPRPRSGRSRRR